MQLGDAFYIVVRRAQPLDEDINPRLHYDNYCKDMQCFQYYGCSYTTYVTQIIDVLCHHASSGTVDYAEDECSHSDVRTAESFQFPSFSSRHLHVSRSSVSKCEFLHKKIVDYNLPNKDRGHLVHSDTAFQFIGPDKDLVLIDSVQKCLEVADIILATGLPNYRMARIPLKSWLNLQAWGQYLADYPDQRLLQYLTFSFPLSIKDSQALSNHEVVNHFSARQFPDAILDYLHKEIKERAIVGPVSEINHPAFHCSPLLTRPKDVNKRRVIMDLSFPRGNAVNDFVDRDAFDGTQFTLRFPTVDDIADDIIVCKDDPVLFKIDVARAFRNLQVDPADSLKLGIQWQGKLYLDVAITFGWSLGTAAFQLCFDAIAFIMSKENVKLHCYIDDYVAVVPRVSSEAAFQSLRTLLHTLGLPVNSDKLTSPTKRLTCLGIEVDIEANVLRIAPDKLHAIHQECLVVCQKTHLTKKQYQSLLGKLLYIQKCVKPSHIFVNRILALFRSHISGRIRLTGEFYQDLDWFIVLLPHFNGVTYISKHPIDESQSLYLDACLTGMGAIWRNMVYATPVIQIPNLTIDHSTS